MSTIIVNPDGEFGAKSWHLVGELRIQPQISKEENLPTAVGTWGEVDRTYSRPVKTLTVRGDGFELAEVQNWEKLAMSGGGDTITIVLATGETFTGGILVGFSRANTDGTLIYSVQLEIEFDTPDPDTITYE